MSDAVRPASRRRTGDARPHPRRRSSARADAGRAARRRLPHASTARSVRCCWPPRRTASCAWPSRARTTTPCCARLARGQPAHPARAGRLDDVARQLDEYFAGAGALRRRRSTCGWPRLPPRGARAPAGDPVRRDRELRRGRRARRVPARRAGGGTACAHNPVPLVVPCHRVVRSDGSSASTSAGPRPSGAAGAGGGMTRRSSALDWPAITAALDDLGCAVAGPVLTAPACARARRALRRRRPVPLDDRHGPPPLRRRAVPLLRPPAAERRRARCAPRSGRTCCRSPGTGRARRAGRRRGRTASTTGSACATTPGSAPDAAAAALRPGDWNALHRDLYGELVFPLQVVIGLDEPGSDYTGGEFVVVEQRPRAQSRATATMIGHGQALVFTTRDRPVRSARGWSAAPMRHGVSVVRAGRRHTLGLVFHDAA